MGHVNFHVIFQAFCVDGWNITRSFNVAGNISTTPNSKLGIKDLIDDFAFKLRVLWKVHLHFMGQTLYGRVTRRP